MKSGTRSIPLQLLVSITITFGMFLLAGIIIFQNFRGSSQNLMDATRVTGKYIANSVNLSVRFPIAPSQIVLNIIRHDSIGAATTLDERLASLPVLAEILNSNPLSRAVFIGYDTGEMFLVRRAHEHGLDLRSPRSASFLVQSKTLTGENTFAGAQLFLDSSLNLLEKRDVNYDIDPRKREWFMRAINSIEVEVTSPYVFRTTGDIGITIAVRAKNAPAVIGIDITTSDISNVLAALRITPNTEMVILDENRNIIAYQDIGSLHLDRASSSSLPNLAQLDVPIIDKIFESQIPEDTMSLFNDGNAEWYGVIFPVTAVSGSTFKIIMAVPARELFSEVWANMYRQILLTIGIMILLQIIGWNFGKRMLQPLRDLTDQVAAIGNFNFAIELGVKTRLTEVRKLGEALSAMRTTIRGFLSISKTLNKEPNLENMLSLILGRLLELVQFTCGAIYLYDDREEKLKLAVSVKGKYEPETALPFALSGSADLGEYLCEHCAGDEIVVPLRNRENALIGVFLLSAAEEGSHVDRSSLLQFVEQISRSAAVAIETRQLILAQKALLDSIITLVANAIDTKSKYTGGHCQRVPVIALMIMKGINEGKDPAFKGFHMSKTEEEEFRIAAWLHDCGKITTPEYVVDKATKLETIYNRIHEIRTRFEVLHREATIACLTAIVNGENPEQAWKVCAEQQTLLQEEFAFVARSNIGGEVMRDEDIERLSVIGRRTWLRYFDDRIGISHDELLHIQGTPVAALPASEELLADKPMHLIPWYDGVPPVQAGDPRNIWGFDMIPPKVMNNYGEIYNLTIRRGTLTAEERFKINDHIVQTIRMLTSLPFPKSLRRVPEIAGRHHEKMDGTGYPCRIPGDKMTLPEKVMAVADVFEALTAVDRPYKDAKNLTQTLGIMANMVKEQHLDKDIFNFFLSSGIYLEYAKAYMQPYQLNEHVVEDFMIKP